LIVVTAGGNQIIDLRKILSTLKRFTFGFMEFAKQFISVSRLSGDFVSWLIIKRYDICDPLYPSMASVIVNLSCSKINFVSISNKNTLLPLLERLYKNSEDNIYVGLINPIDIFHNLIVLQLNNEKNKTFSDMFILPFLDNIFTYLLEVRLNGVIMAFTKMKVIENYALVTLNKESLKIFEGNETFEIRHSNKKIEVKYFVKDCILHINIELNDLRYLLGLISYDEFKEIKNDRKYKKTMALLKDIENNGFDWKELDYKGFPWSNLILSKGK
jgi:hypothetical protein